MRCEQCGRDMKNAELWQLATDPNAPTSWSMQQLCWDCRQHPERATKREAVKRVQPVEKSVTIPELLGTLGFDLMDDYDIASIVSD